MPGNQAVSRFGNDRESRHTLITPDHPFAATLVTQRTEDRLCRAEDSAIGFDELNGSFESFARDLRKAFG
jgi:hypothetical protein